MFKFYTIPKNRYKSVSYGFVTQVTTKLSTAFVEKHLYTTQLEDSAINLEIYFLRATVSATG